MTSALRWAAMTENHFNVSVGSDGQSHKPTVSTNHNLFEEKGEPKRRYRTEVLPLTSLGNALPLGQTGSQRLMHWGSVKVPCWVSHALSSMFIIIQRISRARLLVQCEPIRFGRPASGDTGSDQFQWCPVFDFSHSLHSMKTLTGQQLNQKPQPEKYSGCRIKFLFCFRFSLFSGHRWTQCRFKCCVWRILFKNASSHSFTEIFHFYLSRPNGDSVQNTNDPASVDNDNYACVKDQFSEKFPDQSELSGKMVIFAASSMPSSAP